jgi:YfiR/HmsC-like
MPTSPTQPPSRRRARLRAHVLALLLVCVISDALAQPTQKTPVSLEYAVKATYLYKLAPFVNWPPTEFTAANQPFRICVAGEEPFDDYLSKAVAGRSFGAHPFEVRKLDMLSPGQACQIVFIGHMRAQSVRQALDAVSGEPVLTVTDSGATSDPGGIVQFVMHEGRVGFAIDTAAAARHHLTISSKLLSLAVAVKDEG